MVKKIFTLILLLFLMSCGDGRDITETRGIDRNGNASDSVAPPAFSVTAPVPGSYRPGELIIKFRSSDRAMQRGVLSEGGATVIRSLAGDRIKVVEIPPAMDINDAIIYFAQKRSVEYAEPNYIRRIDKTPDDPLFNQQWGPVDIDAPGAWDISTGSGSIIVALLDSGIDYTHPDLSGNVWDNTGEVLDGKDDDWNGYSDDIRGWDFVNNDNDPRDDNGHGTHVAGIVGAIGNNGIGVAGVNWNVQLMPLKIIGFDGYGDVASEVEAIFYAIQKGASVINASFSGEYFSYSERDAIEQAGKAGILLIAAAGNGGIDGRGDNNDTTANYPANYNLDNIISVTAVDRSGVLPVFANYGPQTVDVGAPGVQILSTMPSSSYAALSGTSMSTPFVTGLAALLFDVYKDFSYLNIRNAILDTVDPDPSLQSKIVSGGKINAFKAVSALIAPSDLETSAVGPASVSLLWKDNSSGEDGFKVERSAADGGFETITQTGKDTTTYTDSSVTDGRAYRYRVKGFMTGAAESAPSNEIAVTTPLLPPTALNVSALSSTEVQLTYQDNTTAEDGYIIERKELTGAFIQAAATGKDVRSFTDTGLKPDTEYTYRVNAFSSVAGNSAFSDEVTVRTPVQPEGSSTSGSGGGGGGCSVITANGRNTGSFDASLFVVIFLAFLFKKRNLPVKKSKTIL